MRIRISRRAGWGALLPLLASLAVLLVLWRRGYELTPDTHTYLEHAIHRTPGYPLFLDLMRLLGGRHSLWLALLVQGILGLLAAHHLSATLRHHLRLPRPIGWLLYGLLLVPVLREGHLIATEPLSHALFLWLLSYLARSFFLPTPAAVLRVAGLSSALLLVRPQFVFLYPLAPLYLIWFFRRRRGQGRQNLYAALGCAAVLSLSPLCQAAHNYAYHGRFTRIPFTGMQALAVISYLSEPADAALFSDPREARYFAACMARITAERWRLQDRGPWQEPFDHFNRAYVLTYLQVVVPEYLRLVGKDDRTALSPDEWVDFDRLALRVSLRLYVRHLPAFLRHVAKQLQDTSGYLPLLMVLVCGLAPLFALRRRSPAALPLLSAGLMGLCNYALISLVEPLGTRYVIYTENIQIPLLLAFCVHVAMAPETGAPASTCTSTSTGLIGETC